MLIRYCIGNLAGHNWLCSGPRIMVMDNANAATASVVNGYGKVCACTVCLLLAHHFHWLDVWSIYYPYINFP